VPQLPDRPDLDQLRRQARELHRAAQGGDAGALRRLRPVSDKVTLSTAQLALAREHGFPSWLRLRDEVEHRRTLLDGPVRDAAGPVPLPPVPGDGTLRLFRGAKLRLVDVEPGLIEAAMGPGQRLVARVRLTGPRGNPICARVNPPYIEWSAEPCK
jgi:Family of unknown function (DUF5990)